MYNVFRYLLMLLCTSAVLAPSTARAQYFGISGGAGCAYATFQAAINAAIATGAPVATVYTLSDPAGNFTWVETGIQANVPIGQTIHIRPGNSTCSLPIAGTIYLFAPR